MFLHPLQLSRADLVRFGLLFNGAVCELALCCLPVLYPML